MKILITGGCGFIGSNLAIFLKKKGFSIFSLDNLSRNGSYLNYLRLKKEKIKNFKYNIASDKQIEKLPKFNLIIDCCAEAAIEASRSSNSEARRVFETNLIGTFNILKKCNDDNSKIIFLSTSRVYSIKKLRDIATNYRFLQKINKKKLIDTNYDTNLPKSLYGFTKKASENLIEEFNYSNNIQFIINRLGVVSGPWQFGKVEQGFLSLWVWRHLNNIKLNYIGFGGTGNQVRDILHIDDLCDLILLQIKKFSKINNIIINVGGGLANSISIKSLTATVSKICKKTVLIGKIKKTSIYDIPYYVSSNSKVKKIYKWKPKKKIKDIIKDVMNWQNSNYRKLKKYF